MTDLPASLPIPDADPKRWWQSRTILGALAVVVSQVAALAGLSVDAGQLTELALSGVAVVGGLIAIWGRMRAEQPIAPLVSQAARTDGTPPHDYDD